MSNMSTGSAPARASHPSNRFIPSATPKRVARADAAKVPYEQLSSPSPGVTARFFDAGHILGSAAVGAGY